MNHRELFVSSDLAKAHLALYLLPRSNVVRLHVDPLAVDPPLDAAQAVLTISLFEGPAGSPLRLDVHEWTGEADTAGGAVDVRVPWAAVWAIQADDEAPHEVDERPACLPVLPPTLTLVRGGAA